MEVGRNGWAASEEPIYNIGVVARMTGIPVATLRVWERRYKFPKASRTPGGHRLYSEKELVRLRWVKASIDEGMQTSQAIRALRNRERQGRIPELAPIPATPQLTADSASLEAFRTRLTNALIGHNLEQADQLMGEVLALYPMENLILDVIRPTLADIGTAWQEERINVATEHLASQFLRQRLTMWLVTGPPTHPIRPIVLACAPDEWHEVSLLMLGVLLRRRRWPVAYLGQAVPLADLAKFVRDIKPPIVVLVAMTEETATELLALPEWLPETIQHGRPVVAFGGRAYNVAPELRERMLGTFLGPTLPEGVDAVERMLRETTALTL
jgi:DNA-binding transcriptional MerR regulator